MDNFTTAITVLLTGFTVVFAVLLLLIAIVKIYSTVVYKLQSKSAQKKQSVSNDSVQKSTIIPTASGAAAVAAPGAISEEIIAVIAAAVESIYSGSGVTTRIKSIKKSADADSRSNWGMAGRIDNTRPF